MKSCILSLTSCAAAVFSSLAGSDYEAVVDDSVIGYWRFNDPSDYGKDSSGHGSGIVQWNNDAGGGVVSASTDWSRGGGCLELPRKKNGSKYDYGSAVATVTSGRSLDMSRTTGGWTVATWVRGSQELLNSLGSSGSSGDLGKFKTALGDGKWHPLVIAFRPGENKDYYRVYVDAFDGTQVTEITAGGNDSPGNPVWHIPLTVSGDKVTLGGDVGGSVKILFRTIDINATFFGGLDDCIVIDRELEGGSNGEADNRETFRFVQTGETFVFARGSASNMFYNQGNWSNKMVPQPGLAYMIENGYEVTSSKTWTFAGKSLSVGRTEKLYGIKSVGGVREVIVDNTVGRLTQVKAKTTMTVDDLVLNDGALTSLSNGQALVSNIRVRAPASKPFEIAVSNGTYTVSGTMKGGGSIVKVGSAELDLSGLTELTAKISLAEGSLVLPAVNPTLSGYTGGTILVDFDEDTGESTPVRVEADWSGALAFSLNGRPSCSGRYAVLEIPTEVKVVTASDFDNQTNPKNHTTTRISIASDGIVQTVFLECLPIADRMGSPALFFE